MKPTSTASRCVRARPCSCPPPKTRSTSSATPPSLLPQCKQIRQLCNHLYLQATCKGRLAFLFMQKILLYLCSTIFDIFGKKYSDGLQSASANGTSITTAVRILASTGHGTLTAVRIFPQLENASRRATECLRKWRKHRDGRQDAYFWRIKYSDGRQSTCPDRRMTILGQDWLCLNWREHPDGRQDACFCRIEHSVGRQSTSAIG